ncbi:MULTISPECIES: hypothetical protein, partial [unclassified Escherichia]|uniref:hypothetical protein n=1 Tax=unclassified Escherichia TaxID=2608889 RepID=UPI0015945D33
MKWQTITALTLISLLCIAGYGVFCWLTEIHLVRLEQKDLKLIASGFSVAFVAWPVLLAGIITGATLIVPVAFVASARARKLDDTTYLEKLRSELSQAEYRASHAEGMARRQFESQMTVAKNREKQAAAELTRIREFQQLAQKLIDESRREAAEARRITAAAETRCQQAEGKAERFKRQRDRLKAAIHTLNEEHENRELNEFITGVGRR